MVTQEYRPVQTLKASSPDEADVAPDVEEREVKADDPKLPAALNARLTAELREVIGAEVVEVPRARPRFSEGEGSDANGVSAYLTMHPLQLVRFTAIVLTFALIVALATNMWWLIPVAAGGHAPGAVTVVLSHVGLLPLSE